MFEAAELDRTIPKEEYKARIPVLRSELLDVQQELIRARFPVIIVFAGVDGAGKGETVNLLNSWMDPRWIVTRAYAQPSDEETERPEYWRYWRDLPRHGRIALFLSSWYSRPCSIASTAAAAAPTSTSSSSASPASSAHSPMTAR